MLSLHVPSERIQDLGPSPVADVVVFSMFFVGKDSQGQSMKTVKYLFFPWM